MAFQGVIDDVVGDREGVVVEKVAAPGYAVVRDVVDAAFGVGIGTDDVGRAGVVIKFTSWEVGELVGSLAEQWGLEGLWASTCLKPSHWVPDCVFKVSGPILEEALIWVRHVPHTYRQMLCHDANP